MKDTPSDPFMCESDALQIVRQSESNDLSKGKSIVYAPYGFPVGLRSLLSFAGQARSTLPGGYFLGNGYRFFDDVLMRFNTPDSISPFGAGGINVYAYCGGDPVNRADPSGHMFKSPTQPLPSFRTAFHENRYAHLRNMAADIKLDGPGSYNVPERSVIVTSSATSSPPLVELTQTDLDNFESYLRQLDNRARSSRQPVVVNQEKSHRQELREVEAERLRVRIKKSRSRYLQSSSGGRSIDDKNLALQLVSLKEQYVAKVASRKFVQMYPHIQKDRLYNISRAVSQILAYIRNGRRV